MQLQFDDADLERLYDDPQFAGGCAADVVKRYRKVIGLIKAAADERDLYAFRGLRFEKLKGKRQHQHSLRLNDQWRLIVEIRGEAPQKKIGVVEIADYH